MTTIFGYVDPSNVSAISVEDLDSVPLDLRNSPSIAVRLPIDGSATESRSFQLGTTAVPEWDVYARVLDEAPLPGPRAYYTPVDTLAFVGAVKSPTAEVVETRVWQQIPIADLYEIKRQDIADQDQSVRYNAVDTALSANWWLVVTRDTRFELDGIQGNWLQRQIDTLGWPGGLNAPWVGIYNANNNTSRRVQVTDSASWNTLYLEKTLHDQATGNATDASLTALDAAYDDGNGVWQDVADHDAADSAWGYPPTVTLQL